MGFVSGIPYNSTKLAGAEGFEPSPFTLTAWRPTVRPHPSSKIGATSGIRTRDLLSDSEMGTTRLPHNRTKLVRCSTVKLPHPEGADGTRTRTSRLPASQCCVLDLNLVGAGGFKPPRARATAFQKQTAIRLRNYAPTETLPSSASSALFIQLQFAQRS